MSYLVKKNKLKPNRFYRKVKLDIEEVLDKFEAQEDLGIDKDIYGDNEGYFLVAEKGKDNYVVRFLTLEQLLINKVLQSEGNRINEFMIDINNIKKIPKQEIDLDELDDAYVRLNFPNIKDELIEQFKTNGKKGIKLNKEYLEEYAKEEKPFGSSKTTPITLNDTPQVDLIGEYETPLPDNTFNKIDGVEELKKNIKNWFEIGVSKGTFKVFGSLIKAPMFSTYIRPLRYILAFGTRYKNNYWDTFKNTGIQTNGQIFTQAFRIFFNDRYSVIGEPNINLYYNPTSIISQFYNIIKDTDRFKKIEVKLLKYFDSNIKTMEDYRATEGTNLYDYNFESQSEIMKVVNSIIKSNVSTDEFSAFIYNYFENILTQTVANEKLKPIYEYDNAWFFISQEERDRIKPEIYRDLKKREGDEPFFEIKDKVMEEQVDKYYGSANGKKYIKDNNLKLGSSKPKKKPVVGDSGKTKLNLDYDPEELKDFDFSSISKEELKRLGDILK